MGGVLMLGFLEGWGVEGEGAGWGCRGDSGIVFSFGDPPPLTASAPLAQ